jgi:site-specific DNA-cytosine methylase
VPQHYYVEDHENGPLRANGAGGPPRTDKQPLVTVAAPLSHGSNPNSNMAGRRREDDENLVTAFSHTQGLDAQPSAKAWPSLRKNGGGMGVGVGVRRLTPTECERLQALPDGWTSHGPDSRRYAALGDAVTASVSEWIGHRLLTPALGQRGSK